MHPRVKQLLFFVVLFMSVGNVMAQLTEKSVRYSDNVIVDFDNTTYCVSYLADGQVWAFPNIQVADVDGVDKVVFNPSGSSIALLRGKKNIVIYNSLKSRYGTQVFLSSSRCPFGGLSATLRRTPRIYLETSPIRIHVIITVQATKST